MEGVETVDVSWLHHSQKDHLSRCKSASSQVSDRSSADAESTAAQPCRVERTTSSNTNTSPPPQGTVPPASETPKDAKNVGSRAAIENGSDEDDKAAETKAVEQSQTPQRSTPRSITGRRNSWISSISSKFSSGSTPPSQSSMKSPSPKATSPMSKLDMPNPFGAAYSLKDKEEERRDEHTPLVSTSPKGPSFLQSAFRKFSSSGKVIPNGGICERRVMNIDHDRDRCKIPDLDQKKLRRVAFCVDVEIAGISRRESDEESPTGASNQKVKRSNSKSKDRDDSKRPQPDVADKEKRRLENGTSRQHPGPLETPSGEAKPNGETKEPTRKQEKKKRSEEERRERKERKRRQAEANGTVPLQLRAEDHEDDVRPAVPGTPRSKTQNHPTTDPVRIYRRCCQLRETPVLKKIVDEISLPSSTLAESPGTVAVLDLTNFPMTSQDMATFCDWLAIVPVRKLILEKCALNDATLRAILAALLATKTIEQMRQRRRRAKKSDIHMLGKEDRFCVVEKLSLKDNPRIGPEGWRHISLFIHLAKSLKAIDLSGIPLPRMPLSANDFSVPLSTSPNPLKPVTDVTTIFANSLAQRFGGDHLEELLLSECNPTTEDVKRVCEAATTLGLRRLGFANNKLTREGLEHVVRYLEAGKCEGLDLGGNPIRDHLDLITTALEGDFPLYALSLADCSLTPSAIHPLLQRLTCLYNLRFIDFSHNPDLFSSKPDALATFRRFLPKMKSLKRIHLADVNLSADHAIALAEILPECPSLCHLNILENPAIAKLAVATDPATQEEACAVYASLMAAVRVSRTIIAVDIEVPGAENNEVVKALASQIVAYCLQNLERGAIEEELSDPADPSSARATVPVPEILQHIVGHGGLGDDICEDEDEPAPDEDYVIGGTGVVKALEVCLGTLHHRDMLGDQSGPPSGTTTPRHRKSRSFDPQRPRDMSKNLLESARNIRTRIQSALVREDRAGNDANYRRLQFLDFTLHRMIQRFEDEYPETRVKPPSVVSALQETSSQISGDDAAAAPAGSGQLFGMTIDENAVDDDDTDQYAVRLSRTSSITSLHARAMTSEEGHVHRLGQNLRRDFLSPSMNQGDGHPSSASLDESHLEALRNKLERLHQEQTSSHFEGANADKAFEEMGSVVEELWAMEKQDTAAFEQWRQTQIAAQINSGKQTASPKPNGAIKEQLEVNQKPS
ncbi:MAP-homologous protein 1 [Aspergillus udagawae]|uniref:MAP-homologous protein 1 n=1 Tax=Aspergillus udagawae TaxID=91492 RepID=A0ABQ1ATR7_9EURO|nr:MAP-homologous protein 1 [Aspergillus udagawae]